jgi:hypothetical protein
MTGLAFFRQKSNILYTRKNVISTFKSLTTLAPARIFLIDIKILGGL